MVWNYLFQWSFWSKTPFKEIMNKTNPRELSQVPPVQMFSVICSEKFFLFFKTVWDLEPFIERPALLWVFSCPVLWFAGQFHDNFIPWDFPSWILLLDYLGSGGWVGVRGVGTDTEIFTMQEIWVICSKLKYLWKL